MSGRKRTQNSPGVEAGWCEEQQVRAKGMSAADAWGLVRGGGRGETGPRLQDEGRMAENMGLPFQGQKSCPSLTKSAGGD